MKKKIIFIISISIAFVLVFLGIWVVLHKKSTHTNLQTNYQPFSTIIHNGEIRVGIIPSATGYFLDGGKIAGFHYEMIENMAAHYNIKVVYIVQKTFWDSFFSLLNNEIDLLATDMPYMMSVDMFFSYTNPHSYDEQVLVQRKNDKYFQQDSNGQIIYLKDTISTVLLPPFSKHEYWQKQFHDKISPKIKVSIDNVQSITDIFDKINNNLADATICDSKIMKGISYLYPNIDYEISLQNSLSLHWLVYKSNQTLLDSINFWLNKYLQTKNYKQIFSKYYDQNSLHAKKIKNNRYLLKNNKISAFDHIFQQYGQKYDIDWRLLSALAYQESKFKPSLFGKKDAFGIMQLTPQTLAHLGVDEMITIEQQIAIGVQLFARLKKRFQDKNVLEEDVYYFALAAYNAGVARIEDAMKMAQYMNLNPTSWADVKQAMLKLNSMEARKKISLKTGLFNAKKTLKYVDEVSVRYIHYCNLTEK